MARHVDNNGSLRRDFAKYFLGFSVVYGLVFCVLIIVGHHRYFASFSDNLASVDRPVVDLQRLETLAEQAEAKADLYSRLIMRDFLADGLVVSRGTQGEAHDLCDSLLFSSLRYVALHKLAMGSVADQAWDSIRESRRIVGRWVRHPRCRNPLSRDMLIGLSIALLHQPAASQRLTKQLLETIESGYGFFDRGLISFVNPFFSDGLRHVATTNGVGEEDLPWIVQSGFPTPGWFVYYQRDGYRSHLLALLTYIELEAARIQYQDLRLDGPVRQRFLRSYLSRDAQARLRWISHRLVLVNPKNLFFRWLRMRATETANLASLGVLLEELLRMPQFPKERLPTDCDREPDYLWQRKHKNYGKRAERCTRVYPGVDYLWMAGLILADLRELGVGPTVRSLTDRPR